MRAIIDFFKSIFSVFFGGKKKNQSPPPTPTSTPRPEPETIPDNTSSDIPSVPSEAEPPVVTPEPPTPADVVVDEPFINEGDDAQDASEIKPDSVVVIVNEEAPINTEGTETTAGETMNPPTVPEPTPPLEETQDDTNTSIPSNHSSRYLWCLDNGHGKFTSGKRSPELADGNRLFEYEFNRDIVKRIMEALDKKGIAYFNVVPEVEIDNFLEGRVKRANEKKSDLPKIYLSIHSNAAPAQSSRHWASDAISGIETWFFHNSRRGRKLATVFQKHIVKKTGWKNRHIKSRPNSQFFVIRKTKMPAILTENGFYNNKRECLELMKNDVRQKIADAHVNAILEIEMNGI